MSRDAGQADGSTERCLISQVGEKHREPRKSAGVGACYFLSG